jgi:hypothetical protein
MQAVFCHCSVCRRSTGSPFVMIGFWAPDSALVDQGAPLLERATSPHLTRHRCPDCGAPIYNAVRSDKLTSNNFSMPLFDALDDAARPTHHIFYADRVLDIDDGLPRFARFTWLPRTSARNR